MRTILFRGKRPNSGKWIMGYLYQDSCFSWILSERFNHPECSCEVLPETVGQFTGLTDKNGKQIFEGDILTTETEKPMIVKWSNKFASWCLYREGWMFAHWFGESCQPEQCSVIGNIHDNPELLNNK